MVGSAAGMTGFEAGSLCLYMGFEWDSLAGIQWRLESRIDWILVHAVNAEIVGFIGYLPLSKCHSGQIYLTPDEICNRRMHRQNN